MVFRAQREITELTFQLRMTAGRLSNLDHEVSFSLDLVSDRGLPKDAIDRKVILLGLVDLELNHVEHEIGRCRNLIQQVLKEEGDCRHDDESV